MRRLALLAALVFALPAAAVSHSHPPKSETAPECRGADTPRCAATVTPAFAPDGTLWLAWAVDGHVHVAQSKDHGATLGPTTRINAERQPIDDNGENRPKVLSGANGIVLVSYTIKADKPLPFSGRVMVSRSVDGGASFSAPVSISDEARPSSQRFETMLMDKRGRVTVLWIDKRNLAAAKQAKGAFAGASLFLARSEDDGSFQGNRLVADHSCECCRLAAALDAEGRPVVLWRHVFPGGVRDHAVSRFDESGAPGPVRRVSEDYWAVEACPHHGPALAIDAEDSLHAVWFTDGARRQGLFHARAEAGRDFGTPMPLGDAAQANSHAHVAAAGTLVAIAWKVFTGEVSEIHAIVSHDGGRSWQPSRKLAATADASDHPLLVSDGRSIFLSWLTKAEGWRLSPVAERGQP